MDVARYHRSSDRESWALSSICRSASTDALVNHSLAVHSPKGETKEPHFSVLEGELQFEHVPASKRIT